MMKIQLSKERTESILKNEVEGSTEVIQSTPEEVEEALVLIDELKYFLTTAPVNWQENQVIRRYYLNNEMGFVSCVFWNNLYYITGTDIVKCCMYRMQKFGRKIVQKKKFEEGIFSDLRNLKCGIDATLELPKSEFLAFLFRNSCLKTQKKQKVFFWFSVPHDKLFADALERDLKREASGHASTTKATNEPAYSFQYDSYMGQSLYDQLVKHVTIKKNTLESTNVKLEDAKENNRMYSGFLKTEDDTLASLSDEEKRESRSTDSRGLDPMIRTLQSSRDSSPTLFDTSDPVQAETRPSSILKHKESINNEMNDFSLDYFPVDIDYSNEEDKLGPLNSDILETVSSTNMYGSNVNPFEEHIFSNFQYGKKNPNSTTGKTPKSSRKSRDYTQELLQLDGLEENEPLKMNDRRKSTKGYENMFNPNQRYGSYEAMRTANLYQSPGYNQYPTEILAQTIEQPMIGFEGIFTPQNVYNKEFQAEPFDWNLLQPSPAHAINSYTPGFRPANAYPWAQGPFVSVGTPANYPMYYPQKTPKFVRRPFMINQPNSSTGNQFSRQRKVTKPAHRSSESYTRESKSSIQDKIKESAKQLQANIQNKTLEKSWQK
ncbi:hypothetical protein KAFR_0D04350 [Kazachstania africana CBS 2517]|uniref:Uncharacterized protein n=1 Tax=Kazachstania africana (strain ATCC 22294 / BCRC 22015 / CBS 2517 / CECT 1963 / NBRC 1671 / NRRL Y-8276) TaxID=1071382 RepID=H2AUN3_KAZAF|nr:hypothetical protein KAFR_0D04350 [Kazachstania africana CBS 2517]CCF58083.1 hypothetical protein KAFR_0D04350 [Kazachstania africana CBS 2517]